MPLLADPPTAPPCTPFPIEDAFVQHAPAVLRQVQRIMRDPDDSYDMALNAWEKAHRAWERRPAATDEVKPWLFRIARNACLDEMRRRQLVRWEPLEWDSTRGGGSDDGPRPNHAALLRSELGDPEHEALRGERMALVRTALRQLPVRYRTSLVLREAEGLSCEQIGVRLGLSAGAVRTTLCRARQRLRQVYLALESKPAAA